MPDSTEPVIRGGASENRPHEILDATMTAALTGVTNVAGIKWAITIAFDGKDVVFKHAMAPATEDPERDTRMLNAVMRKVRPAIAEGKLLGQIERIKPETQAAE